MATYTTRFAATRAAKKAIADGKAPAAQYELVANGREVAIVWKTGGGVRFRPQVFEVAAEPVAAELVDDPLADDRERREFAAEIREQAEADAIAAEVPAELPDAAEADAVTPETMAPAKKAGKAPRKTAKQGKRAGKAKTAGKASPRPAASPNGLLTGVKLSIFDLLRRETGATEAEVCEALGWKQAGATIGRTIKAVLAGGEYTLAKEKEGRVTRYRLVAVS